MPFFVKKQRFFCPCFTRSARVNFQKWRFPLNFEFFGKNIYGDILFHWFDHLFDSKQIVETFPDRTISRIIRISHFIIVPPLAFLLDCFSSSTDMYLSFFQVVAWYLITFSGAKLLLFFDICKKLGILFVVCSDVSAIGVVNFSSCRT